MKRCLWVPLLELGRTIKPLPPFTQGLITYACLCLHLQSPSLLLQASIALLSK